MSQGSQSYSINILPQADEDIIRNVRWWSQNRSMEQAIRWEEAVYNKIEQLTEFPLSHSLAAEDPDFEYELRAALFGLGSRNTHRILFNGQRADKDCAYPGGESLRRRPHLV